jgi:hypothetical protein
VYFMLVISIVLVVGIITLSIMIFIMKRKKRPPY